MGTRILAACASAACLALAGCAVMSVPNGPHHFTDCEPADGLRATESCLNCPDSQNFTHSVLPSYSRWSVPVPRCVANWHARRNIPAAAPYPRFHPLPVRPILSPVDAGSLPDSRWDSSWGSEISNDSAVPPTTQLPAPASARVASNRYQ